MLSWIGIEKGGVALKKNLVMTLLDIQGPIKYMYQSPSQKKNYSVPWHFSSKFKSEIILKC